MDTLEGMRVYVRVVEQRSYSRAAEQLRLSKSLVSKYVTQLEDRLGVRLLNRTTRRMSPTDVGLAYYDRCVRLLEEFDALETSVREQHTSVRGRVRVTGPSSFGELYLVEAISTFARAHPEIEIDLDMTDRFVDLIEEGFDLAVRVADYADSSYIARKLADCPLVVCAAPTYLQRHGRPRRPEDLARHECIIDTNFRKDRTWAFLNPDGVPRSVSVRGALRVNSSNAARGFALDGHGVGLFPLFVVQDDLARGSLVELFSRQRAALYPVHVLYPHNRHLSARVRAFVDHLVEYFRSWREPKSGRRAG